MKIVMDEKGHKIVVLPEVIFKNKHSIDWDAVESYLKKYVGEIVTIAETQDIIYIGNEFPDEFSGSKYTRHLKGSNAKVKANAAQAIPEMLEIATEKEFHANQKDKHSFMAGNGWYYYKTRFAMPTYDNEIKTDIYHIYSARLLINCTAFGKMYLYDLLDIKKKRATHSRTTKHCGRVAKNRFSLLRNISFLLEFVNSRFQFSTKYITKNQTYHIGTNYRNLLPPHAASKLMATFFSSVSTQ